MKKIIAFILTLAMLAPTIMLASCKKDKNGTEDVMSYGKLAISNLTLGGTDTPLGIDTNPTFAWTLSGGKYSNAQSAYQVKVYSSLKKANNDEADMWDSGRVESSNSTAVVYEGEKLSSCATYYCKVTAWDKYDESAATEICEFRTGIFDGDSWKGSWIQAPANNLDYSLSGAKWIWYSGKNNRTSADGGLAATNVCFRSVFEVEAGNMPQKAVFVFSADDYGTFYVNGVAALDVKNSTDRWKSGNIVDITEALKEGKNLLAARITNSSVGYAGFVGKLYLTYKDGTTTTVTTNESDWKALPLAANGWNTDVDFDQGLLTPDQYVSYGQSPWNSQVVFTVEGDRAATMLRKEFTAKDDIKEATVYMSGIGYSILHINGTLADDCFLDPCNTQYNKTVLYRTFDVTKLVSNGENAVAVELGNGFYNEEGGVWNWGSAAWKDSPKLLFFMKITYSDGSVEYIESGKDWKVTTDGPVTFNSIYYGEYYDARREKDGWDKAGYDDSLWSNAVEAKKPSGKLVCQLEEPVRRTEEFKVSSIKKLSDGSYVLYCPEMVAGWIALKVRGAKAGDTITVTYGEKLNANGSVQKLGGNDGVNSGWWPETYIMTDKYTSAGDSESTFEPRFSYKGFQYIQIWGYPGELLESDITIYRIRNDVEITGSFESSNELVNKLHSLMVTTSLNNLQGKPTDTPVWEKNGWLGDFNVALATMNYNFDMQLMTVNFMEIIEDCFEQYGLVPPMAPTAGWNIGENYVWSSLYILGVAETYKTYGSLDYVAEQYQTMVRYADKVANSLKANGWVCPDGQLGDWVSPMGDNPKTQYVESPSEGSGIVGSAMVYLMYKELSNMSALLGKSGSKFEGYMESIYSAFNKKFYNSKSGIYETTTWTQYGTRTKYRQTSNIMALVCGLVPDEYKETVVTNLINDIEKKGNHLDTGCVGTKFILPLLTELGYGELAYTILTQTTYPSWGYMASKGTSLWEMWEDTSRSLGHYFLGTYDEWLYSYLAGIRDIDNGYESFTIAPFIPSELDYVKCTVKTVRGTLESSWQKDENGNVTMTLVVPFGSSANIEIPIEASSVSVNGKTYDSDGFTLGSGTYTIVCSK